MKTLWLLLLALGLATGGRAQSAAPPDPAAGYRYCALVVDDRYFSRPGGMFLDYGQGAGVPVQDAALADAQKQVQLAKSVIAVLNYLNTLGWECFSVLTVPTKHTNSNAYTTYVTSETRYLLRHRIP